MGLGAVAVIGIGAAVVKTAGGIVRATGERKAARAEADAMDVEAAELLETAGEIGDDKTEAVRLFGRETEQLMGAQRTALAASGVSVGGGSAEAMRAETESERTTASGRLALDYQRQIDDLTEDATALTADAETARDIADRRLMGDIFTAVGSGVAAGAGAV